MRYSGMNGRMGMDKSVKDSRRWIGVNANMARHWKRLSARAARRTGRVLFEVEAWDSYVGPVRASITSRDVA